MSPYVVRLIERRGIRQKWHVAVDSAANGERVLTSENYRDRDHALDIATEFATRLNARLEIGERG